VILNVVFDFVRFLLFQIYNQGSFFLLLTVVNKENLFVEFYDSTMF